MLDVVWLTDVLKPILDHRGIIENNEGRQVKRRARAVVGELTVAFLTRKSTHFAETCITVVAVEVFGRQRARRVRPHSRTCGRGKMSDLWESLVFFVRFSTRSAMSRMVDSIAC